MTEKCDDKHYFPRDRFAGTNPAHAVCQKPKGHDGGHEMIRGSMAYCWRTPSVVDDDAALAGQ